MVLQRESKKCDELQAGLAQLKRQKVRGSMTKPREHINNDDGYHSWDVWGRGERTGKGFIGCCCFLFSSGPCCSDVDAVCLFLGYVDGVGV